MRRFILGLVLVTLAFPVWADEASKQAREAKKAAKAEAKQQKSEDEGVFYTNGRMDFVKVEDMRGSELKDRAPQHPATINLDQMKNSLLSITVSDKDLLKKSPDIIQVFNEKAVGFLAPIMVKAFSKAQPNQKVVLSWLTKDPLFILRNDRIVIAECWIKDDQLHMKFNKLLAKLVGDTDKKGDFDDIVGRAKGLRIKLLPSAVIAVTGKNNTEAVISLNGDFSGLNAPDIVAGSNVDPKARAQRTIKDRLSDLDQLRKDKMVTEAEYQVKRKALLDSL
jgi:hypothetical protein